MNESNNSVAALPPSFGITVHIEVFAGFFLLPASRTGAQRLIWLKAGAHVVKSRARSEAAGLFHTFTTVAGSASTSTGCRRNPNSSLQKHSYRRAEVRVLSARRPASSHLQLRRAKAPIRWVWVGVSMGIARTVKKCTEACPFFLAFLHLRRRDVCFPSDNQERI